MKHLKSSCLSIISPATKISLYCCKQKEILFYFNYVLYFSITSQKCTAIFLNFMLCTAISFHFVSCTFISLHFLLCIASSLYFLLYVWLFLPMILILLFSNEIQLIQFISRIFVNMDFITLMLNFPCFATLSQFEPSYILMGQKIWKMLIKCCYYRLNKLPRLSGGALVFEPKPISVFLLLTCFNPRPRSPATNWSKIIPIEKCFLCFKEDSWTLI